MMKPRLLIADDHQLLVDGLRTLLEPDFDLVGVVSDGRTAAGLYAELRPDVLLLDIGMPGLNGIEAARQVKRNFPDARIVFVTMHTDRAYVQEAFRAGGSGYVVKHSAGSELIEAIRTVLRGRHYVSRQLEMVAVADSGSELADFGSHLTPRQREVLQLVAEGKTMKEIARILKISVRTVEFHKNALIQHLGMRTVAELTRYALDHKIAV